MVLSFFDLAGVPVEVARDPGSDGGRGKCTRHRVGELAGRPSGAHADPVLFQIYCDVGNQHFELVRSFGAVPLILNPVSGPSDDLRPARSPPPRCRAHAAAHGRWRS